MNSLQLTQLRHQNQRLLDENQTLKLSLQQLIAVNAELTDSIQQFSNSNTLQERISELENQNKSLKNQLHHYIRKVQSLEHQQSLKNHGHNAEEEAANQELEQVIKELMEKANASQRMYESQIGRLGEELRSQKQHAENQLRKMQQNHAQKIKQYQETIQQLRKKNESISTQIQKKVLKQSQHLQNEQRKNLKVSTTIEDLRNVLTTQIQQKDRIITVYENLIVKLKQKIKQKF